MNYWRQEKIGLQDLARLSPKKKFATSLKSYSKKRRNIAKCTAKQKAPPPKKLKVILFEMVLIYDLCCGRAGQQGNI